MATVDRNLLLCDEKLWLPEGNLLSDQQMSSINERIITQVGNDDSKYGEILCKGLQAIGRANKAKYVVDEKGLQSQKVGDTSETFYESATRDPWGEFIKSLTDICPLFGYTGLNQGIGVDINPSDKFDVNPCPTRPDVPEDDRSLIL